MKAKFVLASAGPMYSSPGSAARNALPTAKANWLYAFTSAFGGQKRSISGSFHISHTMPRLWKWCAAATAQRANAARPSSLDGGSPLS